MENNNIENQNIENPNNKELFWSLFIIVIAVLIFVFFLSRTPEPKPSEDIVIQKSNQVFMNLDIEAKSVFIWDVIKGEEIYSKNSESQLHLASLSKVMMAITALDQLPEGTIVTIDGESLSEEGDSGLFINERWTLRDLIDFSLIVSSNDGAMAVASAVSSQISSDDTNTDVFIRLMNEKAKEIGMTQTYFLNPSGLDKDDLIPGGSGSAKDIALLFEHTLREYPSALEATSYPSIEFDSLDGLEHEAENTNKLVSRLPGIIASKTGFTDIAGGNLAVVMEPEPGRPIILVILGSSKDGRFEDMEKLYLTTLDYIN
jgi:serine-type D-Ala-D-Ala carboxypeptidase (penicillin-binding protein 5/6)